MSSGVSSGTLALLKLAAAQEKRDEAARARRIASSSLLLPTGEELLQRYAEGLDREATVLEAEAHALEGRGAPDRSDPKEAEAETLGNAPSLPH